MLYLGADHAGFELKEALKRHLEWRDEPYQDLGAKKPEPHDDYPHYAFKVARAVAGDPEARGVLVCDTGIGDAIAANKIPGVRAALVHDDFTTKRSREHNDANVVVFGAEELSERRAKELLDLFLKTKFSGQPRHVRRLGEISEVER